MKKFRFVKVLLPLFALFLASCKKTEEPKPVQLATPVITLSDNLVSWQEIEEAESYDIYVNDVVKTSITTNAYRFVETAVGNYSIQVTATSTDALKLTSEKSNAVVYTVKAKLAKPELILSENTVTWNAVTNATGYDVFVNGVSKGVQSTTSYTIAETAVGSYEVEVVAKSTNSLYIESDKSTKVTYTIDPTKLATPVLTLTGNVVSWDEVANATGYEVFVNDTSKGEQTTLSYTITDTAIGDYAVTVKALNPDTAYAASDVSTAVTYTIAPISLDAPALTLTNNVVSWDAISNATGYDVYVNGDKVASQTALSYTINTVQDSKHAVVVKATSTDEHYATSAESNKVTYTFKVDLTKPVLASVKVDDGKVLSLVSGSSYATNLDKVLKVGAAMDLSDLSSLYGSAMQFVPATFTQDTPYNGTNSTHMSDANNVWIDPTMGSFYHIKLADGTYLAFMNGSHMGNTQISFTTNGVLLEENYNYLWQVIETGVDGEYLIRNVAAAMIYANTYNNNSYLCKDNDGHMHQWALGGDATVGYNSAFVFKFTQVEAATMADDARIDLEGNMTIKNNGTFVKFDENMVEGGNTTIETECYVFTFEKVTHATYKDAYRIKVGSKYLTYTAVATFTLNDLNENNNGQIFVIEDLPGIVNGYRIGNLQMGYFGDNFVGTNRLVIFQNANSTMFYQRQNIFEWDWDTTATYIIESTTLEPVEYDDGTQGGDTNPLLSPFVLSNTILNSQLGFISNADTPLDSYLGPKTVGDTMVAIETNYTIASTSTAIVGTQTAAGPWIDVNEKFYYLKTADGYYLSVINGDVVGLSQQYYIVKGVFDSCNANMVWQIIDKGTFYVIRNVGAGNQLKNGYGSDHYVCASTAADGHLHMYGTAEFSNWFQFTITPSTETIGADATLDMNGKTFNIANKYTNSYYMYDATYTERLAQGVAYIKKGTTYTGNGTTDAGYVFTFEKVEDSEFTNAGVAYRENAYRIKNDAGQYLTRVWAGNFEGKAKAEMTTADGYAQIFILKDEGGVHNGFRISNLAEGSAQTTWPNDFDGNPLDIIFKCEDGGGEGVWSRQNWNAWTYHNDVIWLIDPVTVA